MKKLTGKALRRKIRAGKATRAQILRGIRELAKRRKAYTNRRHYAVADVLEHSGDGYRALLQERPLGTCTPEEICGVGTTEMHTIHSGESCCACRLRRKDGGE